MSATSLKSVRFLAFLGGLALILTGECQPVFIGVFVSFFLLGLKVESLPTLARFFGVAQPFLAALVLTIAIVDFFYLSNSFLLTVAHFLLAVQAVRLLALRTNRENFGSLLLSSLMMLSASTLSVEWTFFVMLFIFLMGVIWTLILLTLVEESRTTSASDPGVMEGSLLWQKLIPVLRGATGAAFMVAFSCCAFVFVLFPRFNFQGFRGQFLQPVHKTGFSSQVDLSKGSRVVEDSSIVMRIEIDPQDRPMWTGYLRGRALEMFDGKVWEKYPIAMDRVYRPRGSPILLRSHEPVSKKTFHQNIYLESMDSSLLFSQSRPIAVDVDRPFIDVAQDGSFSRRIGDAWRVRYSVDSSLSTMDPMIAAELPQNPSLAFPSRKRPQKSVFMEQGAKFRRSLGQELLFIPEELKSKITVLGADLGKEGNSLFEKAQLAEKYLRENYGYSLDTTVPPGIQMTPLEAFLFQTKKGHCEYFSASLCLLLRAQGIPARMVTGFLSREWNSKGQYFIVRMKHSHAWVEAYIEPIGWVGFDPSPRDVFDGSGATGLHKWSEIMDTINLRWNRYILSYDFERQVDIVRSVTQQSGRISFSMSRLAHMPSHLQSWISGLFSRDTWAKAKSERTFPKEAILYFTLFGLGVLAIVFWWRSRSTREQDRVWFYKPLLRRLEKRAGGKPSSQTLREFIEKQRPEFEDVFSEVEYLQKTYYRLRFDPSASLTPTETTHLKETLRRVRPSGRRGA